MPEKLHIRRNGAGPRPPDAVEVVYADEWDDLAEVSAAMADALQTIHRIAARGAQHALTDIDAGFDDIELASKVAIDRYHDR